MPLHSFRIFCGLLLLVGFGRVVSADAESLPEAERVLFERASAVLTEHCLRCHSGESPESGLNLTTRDGILAGGELEGAAFDPEDRAASSLLLALRYETLEMPPNGRLADADIQAVENWAQAGLPWPSDRAHLEYEAEEGPPPVNDQTRRFWSFQPLRNPEIPPASWSHNPIDAFIVHRLKEHGLTPSAPADPASLVRRLHYDLLGLPPDPDFVDEWSERLRGDSGQIRQDELSRLTDRLLQSPHYGEHWGRHWLDLVRYAETNSYERDGAKPHVWRYRDYVIRAFNEDRPYDRFLMEQLAGDELFPESADGLIATGYYRLGRWDDEPADRLLAFYDDLDDIITTTCQTMLGLTVNCARCHDHKIDPIPQRDYYRLAAFFRQINRYGRRSARTVEEASVREVALPEDDGTLAVQQQEHARRLAETIRLMEQFEQQVLPLLSPPRKEDFQFEDNRLSIVRSLQGRGLTEAQVSHYADLTERLKELNDSRPTGLAKVLCVTENVRTIHPTFVLQRGSPHSPGEEVSPGFPSVLSAADPVLPPMPADATTSGRRSVLAKWIASPDNPLTARVMVNRIWQYHFGRGLVRSSSDFGFQGTPPTHPDLLDWLAGQFIRSGWSVKALHRLILSSATWQMASAPRAECLEKDPVNDLFWRFDMRRLTAEEIRDSILWASGSLNQTKMFGPSVYTDIPDEVKAGQSRPGSGWGTSSPEERSRRSIYIHVKRSLRDPLLESFDFPDADQTCPVRFETTQPTQALGLMNSAFIQEQAAAFAACVNAEWTRSQQVRWILWRVMQRQPTADQVERGIRFLQDLEQQEGLGPEDALRMFCLLALNLNEFIYLD